MTDNDYSIHILSKLYKDIQTDIGIIPNINFEIGLNNKYKKNDLVRFKHKGKILTGKITKLGINGVDVICNGLYYYCHDSDLRGLFLKSNQTKNYS